MDSMSEIIVSDLSELILATKSTQAWWIRSCSGRSSLPSQQLNGSPRLAMFKQIFHAAVLHKWIGIYYTKWKQFLQGDIKTRLIPFSITNLSFAVCHCTHSLFQLAMFNGLQLPVFRRKHSRLTKTFNHWMINKSFKQCIFKISVPGVCVFKISLKNDDH